MPSSCVSTATFHVRSQSSRSTVVLASAEKIVLSYGSLPQPRNSPVSVIGFVMSLIVRSPSSSKLEPPVWRIAVERNVMTGYSSISKKSALLRWLSRCSKFVCTLEVCTSTSTLEVSGVSPTSTVPENSVKRPRVFVSMWRATKPTSV